MICGSHSAILKKLSEGPAFAVVPVHNSTKGKIVSVTNELKKYRDKGFAFEAVATLTLKIDHYLMAQSCVVSVSELERVMSKAEAMGQCDGYLQSIGIAPEKRYPSDSTGSAARAVSLIMGNAKIAAIAPRSAARAYGLKILATKIQDDKRNKTTFQLLENKMWIKPVKVGIIGINGGFGSLLSGLFQSVGCSVIGSDSKAPTGLTNIEVAERADVVIFAIPIKRTVAAIREIIPHILPDQLLMDVTSIKEPVIKAMLKSKAQVVGLHPMFAPGLGFAGQTIVVCPARLEEPDWKTWIVNFLAATGTKQKWTTGKEHDLYMATVQVAPQSANLINALLIKLFEQARSHFGEAVIQDANELFQRLNAVPKGLGGKDSVILEFAKWDSKPRLLEKILREFGKLGINLNGINFVGFNDNRYQFSISFERTKDSVEVQKALRRITGWKQPRVQVVS